MKKIFTLFVMMMAFTTMWAADVIIIHTNGTQAKYSNFTDAWSSVKSGETIQLQDDRTFDGTYSHGATSFTIDLNGHTITGSSNLTSQYIFAVTGSNTITIMNGKLKMTNSGVAANPKDYLTAIDPYNHYGCLGVGKNGTVIAQNVNFEGGDYCVYSAGTFNSTSCIFKDSKRYQVYPASGSLWNSDIDEVTTGTQAAVYIGNNCTVNMTGSKVVSTGSASAFMTSSSTVTLKSCTLTANSHIALYTYNSAKVKLYACNIKNNSSSQPTLYINNTAEVTIASSTAGYTRVQNDGTYAAVENNSKLICEKSSYSLGPTFQSKGIGLQNSGTATLSNFVIDATGDAVKATAGSVTIDADSDDSYALSEANVLNAAGGKITIETNGRYKGILTKSNGGSIELKGGFYSQNPNSYTASTMYSIRSLSSGDKHYGNGYRYEVVFSPTAYNVTKNIYYDGLYDAINAASAGNEIHLLKDVNLGTIYNITANNLTIDLKGNTINKSSNSSNYDCAVKINADNVTVKNGTVRYGKWPVTDSRVIDVNGNNATLEGLDLQGAKYGVWVEKNKSKAFLDNCEFTSINNALLLVQEGADVVTRYCNFDSENGYTEKLIVLKENAGYTSYVGNTYNHKSDGYGAVQIAKNASFYEANGEFYGEDIFFITWDSSLLHLRNCLLDGKSTAEYNNLLIVFGETILEGCTINDAGLYSTIRQAQPEASLTIQKFNNKATQIKSHMTAIQCENGEVLIKDEATITADEYAIVANGGVTIVENGNLKGKLRTTAGSSAIQIEGGYFSANPYAFVVSGCTSKAIASGSPMYSAGYRYQVTGTPVTSIDALTPEATNAPVYNLQGARLAAPARGINIVGGKKVVIK